MPNAIHQEVVIDAAPARVYETLTDSAQFAAMTGAGRRRSALRPATRSHASTA
jgi:uncharacterized protein YndB with AHSA1/START domain